MNGNKIALSPAAVTGFSRVLKPYLEMVKLHLCLYIGLSAIFGHVMACQRFSFDSLLLGFFVFFLACGSAVLNNIQDRNYDCFFPRTCNRSLPQKKIPVLNAAIFAMALMVFGLSGVLLATGFFPFFWGVMALACYNGLYTPVKKRSLLAIVPGCLSGMLPPLIGWTATGSTLSDPHILMIMTIFGLWQIPHFFIILLKTRPYPSNSPGSKPFPSFTTLFSLDEIKLQILIWTSLYSLAILLFLLNGYIKTAWLSTLAGANAATLALLISVIVFKDKKWKISFAFAAINLSMLLFMGTGICDKIFPG